MKCVNISGGDDFLLIKAELYAGTPDRSSDGSLDCERVLRQAGAIRRRYSQVNDGQSWLVDRSGIGQSLGGSPR